MSRSIRKSPITGRTVCSSEKKDKQEWHRAHRARTRELIDNGQFDDLYDKDFREASDLWKMGKDGKAYWQNAKAEWLRK